MSSFIQFAAISLKPGCHRNTLKPGSRAKRNGANSLFVQWRCDSKIVEAFADTIFASRGSSEWFAQWN